MSHGEYLNGAKQKAVWLLCVNSEAALDWASESHLLLMSWGDVTPSGAPVERREQLRTS
jgi:hypothetical protein